MNMRKILLSRKMLGGGNSGGDGGNSGGGEEWIGDGNTHIWISLQEGRTSPMLGVCPKGTVTVDWGDGSEPDTLTGTSTSTVQWTPTHEYGKAGDYVITLNVDGEVGFNGAGNTNLYANVLRYSSAADGRNKVYQSSVKRVELGYNVTRMSDFSFGYCYALESIIISNSLTNIGDSAFLSCTNLASVTIPNGVITIGKNAFNSCSRITSIDIPGSVTKLDTAAFNACYGMRYYDFTKHTSVPTLTSATILIPSDVEFRVPAALADEWKAATNWSTFADYIVGV